MYQALVSFRLLAHFGWIALCDNFVGVIFDLVNGQFVRFQFHAALAHSHIAGVHGDALFFIPQGFVCGNVDGLVTVIWQCLGGEGGQH